MSQQNMQFDDPRMAPPSEETYTPRQVNRQINQDIRELPRSEQSEYISQPEQAERLNGEDDKGIGYEPGYAGQRQRRDEKLQPGAAPQAQSPRQSYRARRRPRRWLRIIIAVILIGALLSGINHALRTLGPTHTDPLKSFTVNNQAVIHVQDNVGNVTIHRGTGSQVQVEATIKQDFFGHNPTAHYEQTNEGTLNITIDEDRSGLNFVNFSSVNLDITVPDNLSVDIHTSVGNVEIDDFKGTLNASTNAGNVEIDHFTGELTTTTNAGNIEVNDVTLNGDGKLQTNAGNIDFKGKFADSSNYQLKTNAGNVDASFDFDEHLHIQAKTDAGNIHSGLSEVSVHGDGPVNKTAEGSIKPTSNEAHVSLETNAGNIDINS